MEPDVIANLIEAAERWYDASFDLNHAETEARAADRDGTPHTIAHANCNPTNSSSCQRSHP